MNESYPFSQSHRSITMQFIDNIEHMSHIVNNPAIHPFRHSTPSSASHPQKHRLELLLGERNPIPIQQLAQLMRLNLPAEFEFLANLFDILYGQRFVQSRCGLLGHHTVRHIIGRHQTTMTKTNHKKITAVSYVLFIRSRRTQTQQNWRVIRQLLFDCARDCVRDLLMIY